MILFLDFIRHGTCCCYCVAFSIDISLENNSLPYLITSKFSPTTIVKKNIAAFELKLHQRFTFVTSDFSQQAYYGEKKIL